MTTIIAIVIIFLCGFYAGSHYGYSRTMKDITSVIERVEGVNKK